MTGMIKKSMFLLLVLSVVFLAGCAGKQNNDRADGYYYLVDKNNSSLVKVDHEFSADNVMSRIEEIFSIYDNYKGRDFVSPMPEGIERQGWRIRKNVLSVYFDSSYMNLAISDEVLIRAAIVKTFCQFNEVGYVVFYVNDNELAVNGRTVGMMNADSFLDNINLTEGSINLTLYFPINGTQMLREENREVVYNAMYTDEQLVIEELMKGSEDKTLCSSGIPDNTRLLSIVTKDMVCYVNFSKEFQELKNDISPQQTVYSIVNSLCKIPGISSVNLLIEGRSIDHYGSFGLSNQITINYNLVEGYSPAES